MPNLNISQAGWYLIYLDPDDARYITFMHPAKAVEWNEMPFGTETCDPQVPLY